MVNLEAGTRPINDFDLNVSSKPHPLDALGSFVQQLFPNRVNSLLIRLDEDTCSAVIEDWRALGSEDCEIALVIPASKKEFKKLARALKTRTQHNLGTSPDSYKKAGNGHQK